jgi:hypothetical protein
MKKYLLLLTTLCIQSCSTSSDDIKKIAEFPKYGNYCGLDRPSNGEAPTTIDEVDLACKNHDSCYTNKGSFNLTCDTILIAELKGITPKNEIEKVARKSIISFFRNSPQKKLMEINLDNMKM